MKANERVITMFIQWAQGENVWGMLQYMFKRDFEFPDKQHPVLLILLDCVRWEATRQAERPVPLVITEDWRENDENTHGDGLGVDIRAHTSSARYYLLTAAYEVGFTRVGVYCDDLHLHLDIGNYVGNVLYPNHKTWVRECEKDVE